MQRMGLNEALAAVADQTDPNLDVVVVNAAGGHHPDLGSRCGRFALELVNQDGLPLDRPRAANLALSHAHGDWLMFLDDDDLIDAGHVARLREVLQREADAVAAYSGVRLLDSAGRDAGVLDEPFDSTRLWLANYLPIHAVMFARSALAQGARFDESLPIYEDWDFWRQLSLGQRFVHVPGVSATYRLVGDSGLSNQASATLTREGRARFYRKWLPRLDSIELDRLATSAELNRSHQVAQTRQLGQFELQMADAKQYVATLQADVHAKAEGLQAAAVYQAQLLAVIQARDQAMAQMHVEHAAMISARDQAMAQVRVEHVATITAYQAISTDQLAQLTIARSDYQRLDAGYRQLVASLSWRMTAPLRSVRALFAPGVATAAARRWVRALPMSAATKQRIKVSLATSGPLARRTLQWLAPGSVTAQPASRPDAAAAPLDKEVVRADAEAALSTFLQGRQSVHLRCGEGQARVSVVVVLYNQAGLSLLCLQALAASADVDFETILVDNASSDRMPQLLDRVTGAKILRQSSNLGFLRAVNLAAEHATGEHLLLLNNDAVVEARTLAHAVARLAAEPGVAAVGGPIMLWDGHLQEAGSIIWRDGSCLGYGRGDSPDAPAYRFVRDVDYCSGALLMIRRARFEQMGRFDDVFAPAYYEESDFCVRLWEAGHRVVCDPRVRVRHFEFASDEGSGRAIELQTRNRQLLVKRHPDFLAHRPAADPASMLVARHRLPTGAKRVLVIDDRVPLPWLGQGYPRAASLVQAIVAGGDFVTHYPLQFSSERWDDVAKALPETVEVMQGMGLAGLSEFMTERAGYYDVMLVSRPHNMQVVTAALRQAPPAWQRTRIAYDAEALFCLRDIARAAVLGDALPRDVQQQLIATEVGLAKGASVVVTVSESEASHYRDAGYADVQVLGHAIELKPSAARFEQRQGFLFVGAMPADDTPNADSLLWFVASVWPLIVAVMGEDAVLDIVGACEAPSVKALAGASIRIHSAVVDLEPFFNAARVFIVPTRYAAGVPHKAHEAAARGLPLVVSPLIAQQLGWVDRVCIGHDASEFAQACLGLHGDRNAWQASREQLLQAVARDCAPAAFSRQVRAILGHQPSGLAASQRAQLAPGCAEPDAQTTQTRIDPLTPEPPPPLPPPVPPPPMNHQQRLAALRQMRQAEVALARAADVQDSERTADHWGRDARARLQEVNRYRYWSSHPTTAREINRLVSGDVSLGWMQHLKRTYFAKPGRRGLSLGCGSGAVVMDAAGLDIVHQMEGMDISPDAVAVATGRAQAAGWMDRVRFKVVDLNHAVLDGEYDLVLFEQSMHHVDRLGEVLDQCQRILAPGGLFVFNEYVGADRFQWTDEAQRLMDEVLQILPQSHRTDQVSGFVKTAMTRPTPEQVMAVDPSEAIHSSAILEACASRFELVERRDFGGTLLQFMLADIVANFDPDDERDAALLRLMTLLEMELIRAGTISSDFVFAVYRQPTRSHASGSAGSSTRRHRILDQLNRRVL